MNTKSCEYLIAIAEKKTISEAAKSLGITQPTLSSFLSNTERQLKQSLFTRQQKEFIPTEAGQLYLNTCQQILAVKAYTYQSISALCNHYSEHFTVGVTPHRGSTIFSQTFSDFYKRYPNVSINIIEGYLSSLITALDTGKVDMVLGACTKEDRDKYGFVQHNMEELCLCVPDFHPLAALANSEISPRTTMDILQFQDTPFVMWGKQTANRKIVEKLFHEVEMSPTIVYESDNVLLLDNMSQNGIGVCFLPSAYCKPNQNRVYFSVKPALESYIGVYFKKETKLTKAERYFLYLITRITLLDPTMSESHLNDIALNLLEEFKEDKLWTHDN